MWAVSVGAFVPEAALLLSCIFFGAALEFAIGPADEFIENFDIQKSFVLKGGNLKQGERDDGGLDQAPVQVEGYRRVDYNFHGQSQIELGVLKGPIGGRRRRSSGRWCWCSDGGSSGSSEGFESAPEPNDGSDYASGLGENGDVPGYDIEDLPYPAFEISSDQENQDNMSGQEVNEYEMPHESDAFPGQGSEDYPGHKIDYIPIQEGDDYSGQENDDMPHQWDETYPDRETEGMPVHKIEEVPQQDEETYPDSEDIPSHIMDTIPVHGSTLMPGSRVSNSIPVQRGSTVLPSHKRTTAAMPDQSSGFTPGQGTTVFPGQRGSTAMPGQDSYFTQGPADRTTVQDYGSTLPGLYIDTTASRPARQFTSDPESIAHIPMSTEPEFQISSDAPTTPLNDLTNTMGQNSTLKPRTATSTFSYSTSTGKWI